MSNSPVQCFLVLWRHAPQNIGNVQVQSAGYVFCLMFATNMVLNTIAEDANSGNVASWAEKPVLYNAVTTQSREMAVAAAFTESTPADAA